MTARELEMRNKMLRIEEDLVVLTRTRRQRISANLDFDDVAADIVRAKQAIGRIRKHLAMGVYEHG